MEDPPRKNKAESNPKAVCGETCPAHEGGACELEARHPGSGPLWLLRDELGLSPYARPAGLHVETRATALKSNGCTTGVRSSLPLARLLCGPPLA
jgi:hypothetical protein